MKIDIWDYINEELPDLKITWIGESANKNQMYAALWSRERGEIVLTPWDSCDGRTYNADGSEYDEDTQPERKIGFAYQGAERWEILGMLEWYLKSREYYRYLI